MKKAKFEVFKGIDDLFYFRLVAANGQVVAASEGYTRKRNALKTIKAIKSFTGRAKVEELM